MVVVLERESETGHLNGGDDPMDIKKVKAKSQLLFFVNGSKVVDSSPDPSMTLLRYMRTKLGLTGTKLGCGEGGCGACTVMVSQMRGGGPSGRGEKQLVHYTVNACLTPVCSLHGAHVVTVEGIGSTKTRLHEVQKRIADAHGSQCGFCTPGMVMSMYTLLRNDPRPTFTDMETYFQGNLCRCTGYRPILEGFKSFTSGCCKGDDGNGGGKCCKDELIDTDVSSNQEKGNVSNSSSLYMVPGDQELIFPPELSVKYEELATKSVTFVGDRVTWHRPTELEELLELRAAHPEAKLIGGNTELGVETKFKGCHYPILIQTSQIKELNEIAYYNQGISVGAAVTISEVESKLKGISSICSLEQTRVIQQVLKMFHWFAGKQIRNQATLGGNLMTGSPISDLSPVLMASGAQLQVLSASEPQGKWVKFDKNFFTGYRKNKLKPDEVIGSVWIPYTTANEYAVAYKQSRRREDDIAIVNGAFFFEITQPKDDSPRMIENVNIAYGGLAATTLGLEESTLSVMKGQPWCKDTIEKGIDEVMKAVELGQMAPGGMVEYRQTLAGSLLLKAFHEITDMMDGKVPDVQHTEFKSTQLFEIGQSENGPVGKPIKHSSADVQATGEAKYIDDMPRVENEVFLGFVFSTEAHATILSVDPSDALAIPGVLKYFGASDLADDQNTYGIGPLQDEEVFAKNEVKCAGQIIGAVVAEDQDLARRAASRVKVNYQKLPALLSIEDAIEAKSFYPISPKADLKFGDPDKAFQTADHILTGSVKMGGQEHFYMETQCCLVVPANESQELEIFSSTQDATIVQLAVARMLNVGMHKITSRVKRVGGGFGGKESRAVPYALATALVASKMGRPARFMLDRDHDMMSSGTRHPVLGKYRVAFSKEGIIQGLDAELYYNAGCTKDLSQGVMLRGMTHVDNAYNCKNVRVKGYCCKTNVASNTAFRAFGAPQGQIVVEQVMEDIAHATSMRPSDVRLKNLYHEGDTSHINAVLTDCNLLKCWDECEKMASLQSEMSNVEAFNRQNKFKKRGLAMVPVKFGVSFGIPTMNQGGALVNIYKDGSVLLSHAGVEMGQGLHIKTKQVAATVLGVTCDDVHVIETSTSHVPNTSPTAASMGTDIAGGAVQDACQKLKDRLQPYIDSSPDKGWKDWVMAAYKDMVCLSATGFYSSPDLNYNMETNSGKLFNYYTYGVGFSKVEVDCLTGDHTVLKTDIVMDLGESINPAIDIGQIEGAFVQGYGLYVMEQLYHSQDGQLITRGPGAYKIPGFGDIAKEFNVSLLRGSKNPRAVFSSKAVGEPPLFLATSVFFAIKDAIQARRADLGHTEQPRLTAPLTAERIRMACEDEITARVPKYPSEKRWCQQL